MNNIFAQKKYFWRMVSAMFLFVQLASLILFAPPALAAAPTNIISYQGRLLNSNRAPVSDASASVLFELYTLASGGSCVWSNSSSTCASATARTVSLTDGLLSENLGDTSAATPYAAIGDAIFGNNATLFLQVTVNGETLTPRKQITAAPYALNAQLLDGLDADTDGATTSAIVAYNSSGNLVVTGNPSGSGVSQGALFINPDSGDVAANDVLFGIANGGSMRFTLDAEGDGALAGSLIIDGGSFLSSTSTVNMFDDTRGALRIDIGGIDIDRANTVNIATNSTSADTIAIGNSNVLSTLTLTSGKAWSITGLGTGTFTDVECSDCIDWGDVIDSGSLDASTTITADGVDFFQHAVSGGNVGVSTAGGNAFAVESNGNITFTLPEATHPSFNINNLGAGGIITNLASTGGFYIKDNNTTFLSLSDRGAYEYVLDAADSPSYLITNGGTGDIITNLESTGDFFIQDNGTAFASFTDDGEVDFTDTFTVTNVDRLGGVAVASTFDGTWTGVVASRTIDSFHVSGSYQANEAGLTDATYAGMISDARVTSTGDVNSLYGAKLTATVTSTDVAAIESAMYGAYGSSLLSSAVTVPLAYGVYGTTSASAGTITNAYGVYGDIGSSVGSLGAGFGGYFSNTNAGTNRIGIYGAASGGTNNFAGYFTGSLVQIDSDGNPLNTLPTNAAVGGSGDLFVLDSGEFDGSFYAGDSTGTDEFIFASQATTSNVFSLATDALTTGTGMSVSRSNSIASDFDGTLFSLAQNRSSVGSDGTALHVLNMGGGNATALHIVQDQVGDATTAPTAQALVIDVNEDGNNDEVLLIRSDADGNGGGLDTEFRFENDGDAFADGAWTGAGADYAEFFPSADRTLGDYEVVCWDPDHANGVRRCKAGSSDIVGVISTNPGFIGNSYAGAEANLENNPNYALVGLVGQIDTLVSAEADAIKIGDALTVSAVRAGYAAKAQGGTYIIGRALEPLERGTGTIKVLVQPMWYGGDVLTLQGNVATFARDVVLEGMKATEADSLVDSSGLSFVGSAWNGSSAHDVSLTIRNHVLGNGDARLSLRNDDGMDVMTFGSTGDLALAGNFYPSDRGVLQYGAYLYYDSTDAGYMRTNAAGWSSDSLGFAESFASADLLVPGDVVEFAPHGSGVVRSSGEAYSNRIAGVVSSRSAFVAGGVDEGMYPVAVSGRVRTKVSDENGAIVPGDALTTSSRAGFAMKATDSGQIIGYALESLTSGEGSVLIFVRPQYAASKNPIAPSSLAVASQDIESLNVSGVLSMNGGNIVSVGTLSGIGTWEIRENGDIVTNGQLTQVVESLQNTRVSTYATTSTETIVQLSGTATLHGGMARVSFEDIDQNYNDIISPDSTYRVLVTPNGVTGQLYVTDRSNAGFIIRDANEGEGVSVDWLVLAYRYDLVPEHENGGAVSDEGMKLGSDEVYETDGTDGETDVTDVTDGEVVIDPEEIVSPAEEGGLVGEELIGNGEEKDPDDGNGLETFIEGNEAGSDDEVLVNNQEELLNEAGTLPEEIPVSPETVSENAP